MSDDEEPRGGGSELKTWSGARDRVIRFAANLVNFERTIDRLVRNQSAHQKLLNDLDDRVRRIEAQQEIIIRLLERDRRD
jgi:hypothetical protein